MNIKSSRQYYLKIHKRNHKKIYNHWGSVHIKENKFQTAALSFLLFMNKARP